MPQRSGEETRNPKRALITGCTGQDGSYLAELLLEKGYAVHGMVRRVASESRRQRMSRVKHIMDRITLHWGDITNYADVTQAVMEVKPTEIYHLAAQSDVALSFESPFETMRTNVAGTLNVLEAMRLWAPDARMYFAGSSEMFGQVRESPQDEDTPFHPRSPYGISKVAGYHMTQNYREAYGMHCSSGILFNHESPRRGREFVTRKITSGVAAIKRGETDRLDLGNLEARRDWGSAENYVEAMWLMLQQDKPDDYVIATGESHSVKDFAGAAFDVAGLDWQRHVRVSDTFKRPADVQALLGNARKAKKKLGWEPKTKFKELVKLMVEADLG